MKDLKEFNPVITAECVLSNKFIDENTFKCWTSYTLQKRDHITCDIERRKKKGLKYGIKVPETAVEARRFDREMVILPGRMQRLRR